MSRHQGRKVLLTGGLGSLGRAQAAKLAADGARVTVLEHPDIEDGARRASALGAAFVPCDLNDLDAASETVRAAARDAGGFDILINNAALIINRPYDAFTLSQYEDQIRVNSSAAFALTTVCAEHMKAQGWGRVINFTSVTLKGILDGYVPYVASKGALLGLTVTLARELGAHGITVNGVAPGAVVSEAEARVFADKAQDYSDWVLEQQCLKTRIEPEDIADLVSFLVSDEARHITGQNIGIDGGWQGGRAPGT
ncbi:SDR family oxidoreductase [Oceanomicrobium pacificus]|uniref:SDR family oxidoreductase n=1 Tax=Oceanomicrobium pacificus TaxID=2692916 RepID=A0A6B0TKM7_9RHOB|nr:SDR family oxidoreductase [Oceanomicrobium pacificus]MXU64406.1 SDR family oxidoreductase [Oceanomicrobium pacificus]